MKKLIVLPILALSIALLSGCNDTDTPDFEFDNMLITPVEQTDEHDNKVQGSDETFPAAQQETSAQPVDDNQTVTELPAEEEAYYPMADMEWYDEDPMTEIDAMQRVANLYGDNFMQIQTPTGEFNVLELEDGAISILTSSWGSFLGVYYEFHYDIESGTDTLLRRVSSFTSAMLDRRLTDDDMQVITGAVDKVKPGMSEPVLFELDDHLLLIAYDSDGFVTVVY